MIKLTAPYSDAKLKAEFLTILKNTDFGGNKYISKFIAGFNALYHLPYGVAVNSGTSALIIVLRALGAKKNSEIITPAYTCKAILDAINLIGAKPVLVDNYCDYVNMNFNPDENDILAKINNKTAAIILPYAFGHIQNYNRLFKHNIPIIEDVTLSLGAKIPREKSRQRIIVSSFHSSKVISSVEGGIISTNDKSLFHKLEILTDILKINRDERLMPPTAIKYSLTFSCRPSELNFIWGYLQLKQLPKFIKERQKSARYYLQKLDKNKYLIPKYNPSTTYYRFIIGLKTSTVPRLLRYLKRHDIEGGRGVYPLLSHYLKTVSPKNATFATNHSLSLPIYPGLTPKQLNQIITALNNYDE